MNDGPKYQCKVCSKCYKRREHLQRHSDSHNSDRPHSCGVCGRTFQRSDVLKRHLQTCDGKKNPAPTKRRACDQCVRQKKACDLQSPCQNCTKKDVQCYYSFGSEVGLQQSSETYSEPGMNGDSGIDDVTAADRLDIDEMFQIHSNMAYLGPTSDLDFFDWKEFVNDYESHNADLFESKATSAKPFHFLDKFTSTTGLISSFDCGTLSQREQVVVDVSVLEGDYRSSQQELVPSSEPAYQNEASSWFNEETGTVKTFVDVKTFGNTSAADPLHWRTHQIILLVKEVITLKPRNSPIALSWSPVLEQMCLEFFCPSKLRKYMALYWAVWHPNVNLIHHPTFDPRTCKPILLASMSLIGACVSPNLSDNENAKIWFDCVEEMVFTDVDFGSDSMSATEQSPFNAATNRSKIQALQAAYHVCLYQNWEGSDIGKRRLSKNESIADDEQAVRDIGISTAQHRRYNVSNVEFDWAEFAATEELVRTFIWVLLLDTAFVIFNNLPPRMMVKEATMHPACPEACFQAASAEECYEQILFWRVHNSPVFQLSFRSAIDMLRQKPLPSSNHRALAYLGPLNLFVLTSAFHTLIFQYQNSFGGEDQLIPLRNALDNWNATWEIYAAEFAFCLPHATVTSESMTVKTMGARIGFMRHSHEFWLLASLMTDHILALTYQKQANQERRDAGDGRLLLDNPQDPILHDYDQTSMRQVNDLITVFQNVQIEEQVHQEGL